MPFGHISEKISHTIELTLTEQFHDYFNMNKGEKIEDDGSL